MRTCLHHVVRQPAHHADAVPPAKHQPDRHSVGEISAPDPGRLGRADGPRGSGRMREAGPEQEEAG